MEPRPFSWLFRRRTVGVLLFVLVVLFTLGAVFQIVENWRGKRKWEAYRRALSAQGVKLDLAALIPPPIPDEQNFAATPFFAELFPGPLPTNRARWPNNFDRSNKRLEKAAGKRSERQLTDLIAWQKTWRTVTGADTNALATDRASAARELLAAFKIYEPALEELRAASKRPLARYNIRYNLENPYGILLPHLAVIKKTCYLLQVRSCAELAAGNPDGAMDDIRLMARIADSLETEAFLISYTVRAACWHLLLQPVWEGLALDLWSDAQLAELQAMALRFNCLAQLSAALGTERAAGIMMADLLLKQRNKADHFYAFTSFEGQGEPPGFANVVAEFIPRGWFQLEQYNYARLFQELVLPGFDVSRRVVFPLTSRQNERRLDEIFRKVPNRILGHYTLASLCLPAIAATQRKSAQAQTAAHQAAIACALERYRRAQGDYPSELAALDPQFLAPIPHDVIAGKPMRYKPGEPVALYSIGWDEKDDGGAPGKLLWDETGDWVWTYPSR